MFNENQSKLFNQGYGAYREILQIIIDNVKNMPSNDDNTIPALVLMADVEIQKMLLDISSCQQYALTEDEQIYIKSLIESSEALKTLIPGYSKFLRDMTPANYNNVKARACSH